MRVHGETFLRPRPKPWQPSRRSIKETIEQVVGWPGWNAKEDGPIQGVLGEGVLGEVRGPSVVTICAPETPFPAGLNCRCEYCVKERENKP